MDCLRRSYYPPDIEQEYSSALRVVHSRYRKNLIFSSGETLEEKPEMNFLYVKANHLGNVRAVVGGRKKTGNIPHIFLLADQYPFGMPMPSRQYLAEEYRFGYNGERDNEMKGSGNSIDFGDRMNDTRLGRWFSTDHYHQMPSSYSSMGNSPIFFTDNGGNFVIKGTPTEQARLRGIVSMAREMLDNDAQAREAFLTWTGYKTIEEAYAEIFEEGKGPVLEFKKFKTDEGEEGPKGITTRFGGAVYLSDVYNLEKMGQLEFFLSAWVLLHEGVHVGRVKNNFWMGFRGNDDLTTREEVKFKNILPKKVIDATSLYTLTNYYRMGLEPGNGMEAQVLGGIISKVKKENEILFNNYVERRLALSQTSQFNQQLQLHTQEAAMKTITNIAGLPKTINPVDIPVQSGVIPGGGSGINVGGFGGFGGGGGGAPSVPLPSPKGGPMFQ